MRLRFVGGSCDGMILACAEPLRGIMRVPVAPNDPVLPVAEAHKAVTRVYTTEIYELMTFRGQQAYKLEGMTDQEALTRIAGW